MKKILFTLVFMAALMFAGAQNLAESNIMFNKATVPCVTMQLNTYPVDVVKDAITARFEKTAIPALKATKAKGCFKAYAKQLFIDFCPTAIDIYVFADPLDKKKSNSVSLSIVISKGGEYVSSQNEPVIVENVIKFLTEFNRYLFEFDLKMKITNQNGVLNKQQNDLTKLNSDLDKMNKEIADIKAKILKKEEEIKNKNVEIEHTKVQIEELNRRF